MIAALNAFDGARPRASALDVTGLLAWKKHRHGEATFRAYHGDDAVGRIFKRADHSMTETNVYSVEILGNQVSGTFHHIRDAREAGECAFVARQAEDMP